MRDMKDESEAGDAVYDDADAMARMADILV